MVRLLIYLLLFGLMLYFFSRKKATLSEPVGEKRRHWLRPKKNPREMWIQVYETESLEEARRLQARLEEDELNCVLYEKGKKDIHGNAMKGIGIAVPKTAASRAQGIITRMPV